MATLIPLSDASRRPTHFLFVTLSIIVINVFVFIEELMGGWQPLSDRFEFSGGAAFTLSVKGAGFRSGRYHDGPGECGAIWT